MKNVLIEAAEALLSHLQTKTAEWGFPQTVVFRTWKPMVEVENLSETQTTGTQIFVYPQDCDFARELVQGVEKTISLSVAMVAWVASSDNATIDPLVEEFETLQNHLAEVEQIFRNGQGYVFKSVQTVDCVEQNWLKNMNVVLFRIDVELETHVE
ncbi:MAG: hypothetical protein Q4D38_11660 [Planctomycetia bacterium]|nr:hypothetical protein [Planctomycetia bacterium]